MTSDNLKPGDRIVVRKRNESSWLALGYFENDITSASPDASGHYKGWVDIFPRPWYPYGQVATVESTPTRYTIVVRTDEGKVWGHPMFLWNVDKEEAK